MEEKDIILNKLDIIIQKLDSIGIIVYNELVLNKVKEDKKEEKKMIKRARKKLKEENIALKDYD